MGYHKNHRIIEKEIIMKKIYQPYVETKAPGFAGGSRRCILQTKGLQLVGAIHLFKPTHADEAERRSFIDGHKNPYLWAKAAGYRIYIRLEGSLRYISPEETEERQEEIHTILAEMAEYYADNITDGMRRQYADGQTLVDRPNQIRRDEE